MDLAATERVPSLWFLDGNIVISVRGVLFRVFRGILAAHSSVLAEMLATDAEEGTESKREMVDGCPVLVLDDSAADMMYFLKALFDYEFFAPYPAKTDFDAIHGVLRLGTKYRVEPLRRRALQHLSSVHPTSLLAWDALCATSPSASTSSLGSSTSASAAPVPAPRSPTTRAPAPALALTDPYAAGPSFDFSHLELPIIALARAASAPWILPTAFLRALAVLSTSDILGGIDYTGVHVELERADKLLLLDARGMGEQVSDVLGFLWSPMAIPGCTGRSGSDGGTGMSACTADRMAVRAAAERWRADGLFPIAISTGPVPGTFAEDDEQDDKDMDQDADDSGRAIWSEEDFTRLRVCSTCMAYMRADWTSRRERFWERLSAVWGLPKWEELERMRRESGC
ncbi:unnamed protein product [Mycena citricolor]|uniref:BTB domain-containing protein n=1 Tax=Mycena citricolor TaxID=2018698 RepID=A0AAD2GX21_9AGAR|nr:unnamed protein product [Mycena citricolor]